MHLIEDHAEKAEIPVRFAASKIMEGDEKILEQLNLTENEKNLLEDISRQTEEETGLDRAAAIAQMRFAYIEDVCSESVIKPKESREHLRSRKIDRFLTGKYTGSCILAYFQCNRSIFAGASGVWNHGTNGCRGPCNDSSACKQCGTFAGD